MLQNFPRQRVELSVLQKGHPTVFSKFSMRDSIAIKHSRLITQGIVQILHTPLRLVFPFFFFAILDHFFSITGAEIERGML